MAAGKEVGRLSHVRIARLELVVGSDGHIDVGFCVAAEIADQEAMSPVGIVPPALEGRRHARAKLLGRRGRESDGLLSENENATGKYKSSTRCKSCRSSHDQCSLNGPADGPAGW